MSIVTAAFAARIVMEGEMSLSSWLTLEKEDIEGADQLASVYYDIAIKLDRPAGNGCPQSMVPDIIGCRGERAGYLYLRPLVWLHQPSVYIHKRPDYQAGSLIIDAKTRSKAWYDLIVQADDPPDWAYLLIRAHDHPTYEIVGWCYGLEAKREENWREYVPGRPAYYVKQSDPVMKNPPTLYDEVRCRQASFGG